MANEYSTLIGLLETAISNFSGTPGEISANGRTVRYRSLKDLTDALDWAKANNLSGDVRSKIRLACIKSPGAA